MERSQAPLGQKAEHGIWLAEEMCSSTWQHTQSCKGKVTLMGVDMSMDVGMGMDMAMGIDTGMERHWHVGRSRAGSTDTLVCLPTHVGSWRSCWGRSCWRVPVCVTPTWSPHPSCRGWPGEVALGGRLNTLCKEQHS